MIGFHLPPITRRRGWRTAGLSATLARDETGMFISSAYETSRQANFFAAGSLE